MTTEQPYHICIDYSVVDCDSDYSVLLGPDGFECVLTEPEDRTWGRDGSIVIDRLNEQYERIQSFIAELACIRILLQAATDELKELKRELLENSDSEYDSGYDDGYDVGYEAGCDDN